MTVGQEAQNKLDLGFRRQFVKDYKFPTKVLDDGYFNYFIDLYSQHFGYSQALQNLYKCVDDFKTSEDFTSYKKSVIEDVVIYVEGLEEYKDFKNNVFPCDKSKGYPVKFYKSENVDKKFISIDMKQSNFQVFNDFVFDMKSYEDFIGNFTKYDYIINSKSIRQAIFGKLEPRQQQRVQENIMNKVALVLQDELLFDQELIAFVSGDEVIVEITHTEDDLQSIREIDNCLRGNHRLKDYDFSIESFVLMKNGDSRKTGYRKYINGDFNNPVFKCVEGKYFAQVFKKFYELPICEKDLSFKYDDDIVKFTQALF